MRQHRKGPGPDALSILTVDDDPIMTATIQSYFQRSGYRVDGENDPVQAIERIRHGHYDILLLDYLMSPICGDQVVEEIRQFNQDVFIILLTGHRNMVPPIKTVRTLDIQGYYEKSDRFDQLELLVEACAKAIRQMRTVRSYKDGLSSILDSLPKIYDLTTAGHISDTILRTAAQLVDCTSVVTTMDTTRCPLPPPQEVGASTFLSRGRGDQFSAPTPQQARELLQALEGKRFLIRDRQVIFPFLDNDQHPMGLLAVEPKEPLASHQLQLLEVFSSQVSSALCNAFLHTLSQNNQKKLEDAYAQMKGSYLEMVSAMRHIVDTKDIYTRGHSDRVSYYAAKLGQRLGLSPHHCEKLHITGLFHDLGKLSIPDEILRKNGQLSQEEYEIIKTHPRKGAELLSVITQFHPILPGVLSHHERIDGTGYPDGLKGEDIPEDARIIAVADAFDAMTSDRQYRQRLDLDAALAELERSRGTQLDPLLVDAFVSMVREPAFFPAMEQSIRETRLPQRTPR